MRKTNFSLTFHQHRQVANHQKLPTEKFKAYLGVIALSIYITNCGVGKGCRLACGAFESDLLFENQSSKVHSEAGRPSF